MFPWFAENADIVVVFDNSGPAPALGAVKGPAGWLAHHFAGTHTAARPEWMLLDTASLGADLTAMISAMAAAV